MPMRLNVGFSKKIGQPDFGSLGASVNLELELDSGVVGDQNRLRHQIRQLFGMAKTSVDQALCDQQRGFQNEAGRDRDMKGHGDAQRTVILNHEGRGLNRRSATQSQIRAIKAIANRQRLSLRPQLEKFGVCAVEDLGVQQASDLIDDLKAQPAGIGGNR